MKTYYSILIAELDADKFNQDTCREWAHSAFNEGYGAVVVGNQVRGVHRVVMEYKLSRTLLRKEVVMHSCDNKICYKPIAFKRR
jgi:hypothetical protein